eukprot:TRINITY_DN36941_c0_g1_i1.p1 TRINITY_DN36941_c0_g1~~TRINITY_DN36941_c0_g1_i1.p1  ORF type:complete len:174 (+),score=23.92 TRINITY_DN36941_c0_g1_i1:125-646(+)
MASSYMIPSAQATYNGGVATYAGPTYGATQSYGGAYSAPSFVPSTEFQQVPTMGAPQESSFSGVGVSSNLASAPSMLVTGYSQPSPYATNLQSSPSMIAYPGMTGLPPYPSGSAMDGPFKFYATPPGDLPASEPAATANVSSAGAPHVSSEGKKTSKKYTSSRKKKTGCGGCC